MYKILPAGSLFFIVLTIGYASPAHAVATTTIATATTSVEAATTTATSTLAQNSSVVEKRVREFFADMPVMVEIARCESGFRQFTDSGTPFRGGAGGGMVGVFQFYEKFHTTAARALGFDLNTLEGNIGYAKQVYQQSGTGPWVSCVPAVVPTLTDATKELKIKLLTQVIELLTELLKLKLAGK